MIRLLRRLLLGVVVAVAVTPAAAVAAQEGEVLVTVDPAELTTSVGTDVTLTITVTNNTSAPTDALAVHIDVTDPTGAGSVDPEDWSNTLTRRIGSVDADSSRELSWVVKPISGGTFRAYAVALPESGSGDVWVSNGVIFGVDEKRALNPEGVLPVAIAAPGALGLLLLVNIRRNRAAIR